MGEGLDVGTLTGRIELEDRLSNTLGQVGGAIGKFQDSFKDLGSSVLENAASFFTAEAALHAVEGAIHLGVEALKELTLEGASVADVEDNFNHLMETSGRLGSTLIGALAEGTHNTITNFDLMKTATGDLAAGMNLTDAQFKTMATGGFALAQAKGIDVKEAFDSINDAMLTGRTRGIAYLVGKIDQVAAEDKFAASLKTTADRLTAEEKIEANRAAILDKVAEATHKLGDQSDGLDEKIAQVSTQWKNFTEELGKTVATSPVILTAFDSIREELASAFGGSQETLVHNISTAINKAAISALEFAKTGADVAGVIGMEWNAAQVVFKDLEQIIAGDVLVFKYLAEGIAEVGSLLHFQGAAEDVARIDNEIQNLMASMMERAESIKKDKAEQIEWAVVTGQIGDKIEVVRQKMIAAQKDLDAHTAATKEGAKANEAGAVAAGKHADETGKLGDNSRMTKDEQKKLAEAMAELVGVGETWEKTLDTLDGTVVESVKYYLQAGVALDKLAVAYGLTQTQANAISEAWKRGVKDLESQIKALDMLTDLWGKYYEEVEALGATDSDKIRLKAEHDYEAQVAKLQELGDKTKEHYDQLWEIRQRSIELEDQQRLLADQRSKASMDQRLASARETFEFMRSHSDQYTQADIDNQKKIVSSLVDMREHWGQINSVIDTQTEMVKTLSGEVLTLKEYEAKQAAGGSGDVTRDNFDAMLGQFHIQNAQKAYQMAAAGYSFSEIVKYNQLGGAMPPAQGPRIPGFRDGGVGDFGEGTIAMLHGKEAIVPLDRAGSFGQTNIFYINGTAADVARQVSDVIMRDLKNGKQFGSA